jgi:hypothetical protein
LDRRLGGRAEPVWTQRLKEKSFRLYRGSNLDRPVVQPIARHYTDLATDSRQNKIPAYKLTQNLKKHMRVLIKGSFYKSNYGVV